MKTTSKSLVRIERKAQALELRRQGCTYPEIAQQTGTSLSCAHDTVAKAMAERMTQCNELADTLIAIELDRLDGMFRPLYLAAVHGDVQAVDRCLRIMERRARLLGLDKAATAQIDLAFRRGTIESYTDAELEQIIADAQARDSDPEAE